MDWSKVDAALAAALADDGGQRCTVLVHLTADVEPDLLKALGVSAAGEGLVRTATVSPTEVERLSDQPWVSLLRLSRRLGPYGPP